MKKEIMISCIGIFILVVIIAISTIPTNSITFIQDGVTYALTLDGASTNTFPSKGMYRVNVICEGAIGKWLYDEWQLAIENITSNNINCNIDFTTIEKENLNNYIINLSNSMQGNGQVIPENGYRYEGKNPNNYIWFNNELWRIIGVFDSESHGQSGENLVKIIRKDSLGGLAWHKSGNTNDWTRASLMNLLNGAYLNAEDGTGGEYCYGYSTRVPSNCDYTSIGIDDTYRNMIANVRWHLGGHSTTSATADAFYTAERGATVYSGHSTYWDGKIGLMYVSDYGYSVLASSCARTTNLGSYNNATCAGQSWLYGQGYEWTITPYSSRYGSLLIIYPSGNLSYYSTSPSAELARAVRPVLYLDSSVYVIDGNGSQSDPYIIGM